MSVVLKKLTTNTSLPTFVQGKSYNSCLTEPTFYNTEAVTERVKRGRGTPLNTSTVTINQQLTSPFRYFMTSEKIFGLVVLSTLRTWTHNNYQEWADTFLTF